MSTAYKPADHNSVSPYLIVNDATATIAFLEKAFGAKEVMRLPNDEGKIRHAEVRLDDTVVMLSDPAPGWPAVPSHVHMYVPDVEEAYRRALAAGATSVQAPMKKGDADKRGGVKDTGGTTWWIATKVE